jgi:hypothetical protein
MFLLSLGNCNLKLWINISGTAAFRGVAGNILEFALFFAAWAGIRSDCCS